MQQFAAAVLSALGGTLVLIGGYHFLFAAPRARRLADILATHDELLGGGSEQATGRLDAMSAALAELAVASDDAVRRIEALEEIARSQTPRVGFVRYNAFADVGSDLSYALALLTREGDGVVLSSIYSREDTRTYGKAVSKFTTERESSAEEREAIARAKALAT